MQGNAMSDIGVCGKPHWYQNEDVGDNPIMPINNCVLASRYLFSASCRIYMIKIIVYILSFASHLTGIHKDMADKKCFCVHLFHGYNQVGTST